MRPPARFESPYSCRLPHLPKPNPAWRSPILQMWQRLFQLTIVTVTLTGLWGLSLIGEPDGSRLGPPPERAAPAGPHPAVLRDRRHPAPRAERPVVLQRGERPHCQHLAACGKRLSFAGPLLRNQPATYHSLHPAGRRLRRTRRRALHHTSGTGPSALPAARAADRLRKAISDSSGDVGPGVVP